MHASIKLFRALSRYYLSRVMRIATFVVLSIALCMGLGVWALAHFFSPWWWLLAIPVVALLIVFLIIRCLIMLVARVIYPDNVSRTQAQGITDFIDKINRLLELKHINPTIIAFASLKDFIFYRELRTLRSFIDDSTSLARDFKKLNDQFK